jgi:excisionase family DNA binding protein
MHIYTAKQAAALLAVSEQTVRVWLRNGLLKGSKIGAGRMWRITGEAIAEIMKNCEKAR